MSKPPKTILVRSPNWIGDQLMSLPFFYYLRKAYPSSKIAVSCVPWVQAIQFKNYVDEVIPLLQPQEPGLWAKLEAMESSARVLRNAGPWDLGICLPRSFSSAWLMARSGVTRRRGFRADSRGFLLNEAREASGMESLHRSEEYLRLLLPEVPTPGAVEDYWGDPPEDPLDPRPEGLLPPFQPLVAWPEMTPVEPPLEPYWVLAPGSMAESRRWSVESWLRLAQLVSQRSSLKGVIVGGTAESSIAAKLVEDASLRLEDWTQRGSASSYWKVLAQARFSVCNDSGLAHLAALCGKRVQVVWGAGRVGKTRPLGRALVKLSVNPVECWPCEKNECLRRTGKRLECISGVLPEGVWEELASECS